MKVSFSPSPVRMSKPQNTQASNTQATVKPQQVHQRQGWGFQLELYPITHLPKPLELHQEFTLQQSIRTLDKLQNPRLDMLDFYYPPYQSEEQILTHLEEVYEKASAVDTGETTNIDIYDVLHQYDKREPVPAKQDIRTSNQAIVDAWNQHFPEIPMILHKGTTPKLLGKEEGFIPKEVLNFLQALANRNVRISNGQNIKPAYWIKLLFTPSTQAEALALEERQLIGFNEPNENKIILRQVVSFMKQLDSILARKIEPPILKAEKAPKSSDAP